jgi:hypothetical protein
MRLPGRRAEPDPEPPVTDPGLPHIRAELRDWEAAGLIAGGWEVEEIDAQVAGMLGELRNHLSPSAGSPTEPRWFLVTRTHRGVRSVRVFDHEDPAKTAFESEERWAKANPEHGVDCALFGASHLSQVVVAHSDWFDPRPPQPPPTGDSTGLG